MDPVFICFCAESGNSRISLLQQRGGLLGRGFSSALDPLALYRHPAAEHIAIPWAAAPRGHGLSVFLVQLSGIWFFIISLQ